MNIKVLEQLKNKERFYSSVKNIDISNDGEYTIITYHMNSGKWFSIKYIQGKGPEYVSMKYTDKNGVVKPLKPDYTLRGVLFINRENTKIYINELIHNGYNGYLGYPLEVGEFNHHFPIAFGKGEVMSPFSGDITTRSQNNAHWTLLSRIREVTGKTCRMHSYGPEYQLLGIDYINNPELFKTELNNWLAMDYSDLKEGMV